MMMVLGTDIEDIMKKIIDTFMFFNELDLLEGRLEYLYPVVDKFIIVESNLTFSGKEKDFLLSKNFKRYKKYRDKIIYLQYNIDISDYELSDDKPKDIDYTHFSWKIEEEQRNYPIKVLEHFGNDAVVLINDLDEIPKKSSLLEAVQLLDENKIFGMIFDLYYYNLNNEPKLNDWWGSCLSTVNTIKRYGNIGDIRRHRAQFRDDNQIMLNSGWHLSYWGGFDKIRYKIDSFSHQELNNEEHLNKMKESFEQTKTATQYKTQDQELIENFARYSTNQ
jgi:beta-1,4-mannosyl-glycoprotein beta-1,4-N-acetylglucosaminyltransferase